MNDHVANHKLPHRKPAWPHWLLLVALVFIAAESALLAVVMKGAWFVLLAPALACGFQAQQTWRELRRCFGPDQRNATGQS